MMLVLVMLGGAWLPSFVFPPWLQHLTMVMPTRWAADGLEAMTWRGLPLQAALAPAAGLVACALAFALVAPWPFDCEAD
ncbi:MAG: ABC transporter permease [Proteobacteria bacterium]|nr:ABC transporter permease [Pseudomonadota bacterium]